MYIVDKDGKEYILDPAILIFKEYLSSGYKIRTKRKLEHPLKRGSGRMFKISKVYRSKAFEKIQTGVIGTTPDRNFALAHGFIINSVDILPVIKMYNHQSRILLFPNLNIEKKDVNYETTKKIVSILKNFKIKK